MSGSPTAGELGLEVHVPGSNAEGRSPVLCLKEQARRRESVVGHCENSLRHSFSIVLAVVGGASTGPPGVPEGSVTPSVFSSRRRMRSLRWA
jgi:hypothetical protein